MAGAGLISIKRRINSINNTKKITRAMGLVATSKLRKTREKLEINNIYYNKLEEVLSRIVLDIESEDNIFLHGNKSDKKLFIVLTSDTGLCGGFNSFVVKKGAEYFLEDNNNSLLSIVGQKGKNYFKKLSIDAYEEYLDNPDIPSIKTAQIIANKALETYTEGKVGEVNIVYTKFFSTVKQEVTVRKLLPIDKYKKNKDDFYTEYEPNDEKIIFSVIKNYLNECILNCMLNAKASEQGARMTAMDGATRNADDLLDKIKLKYNRIRQGVITQEISEIIGGSEAQR